MAARSHAAIVFCRYSAEFDYSFCCMNYIYTYNHKFTGIVKICAVENSILNFLSGILFYTFQEVYSIFEKSIYE